MKLHNIHAFILLIILFLMGCKENNEAPHLPETTTTIAEERGINLANLLGTWVNVDDTKQQFTLYNDGSIRQENITELALKDWTLNENKIIFARKNSNSGQTQMNSVIYNIKELTDDKLTLERDGIIFTYNKK